MRENNGRAHWSAEHILIPLAQARRAQGAFHQEFAAITQSDRLPMQVEALTNEVIGTSTLASKKLNPESIHSLIRRRLRAGDRGDRGDRATVNDAPYDLRTFGIVEVLLDATKSSEEPLDHAKLCYWHLCLGTEPPSSDGAITTWLHTVARMDGLLRSAMAHVSFPAANGIVRRAVATMALAQDDPSSQRLLSVSEQFAMQTVEYHDALARVRRNSGDVTEWLTLYLAAYVKAIHTAGGRSATRSRSGQFWTRHREVNFSDRQRTILNRYLQQSLGWLTAREWAAMGNTSVDTAERDLRDLVAKRVIVRNPPAGKRTSYSLLAGVTKTASSVAPDDGHALLTSTQA
jgi:hypothetical protein